MRTNRKFLNLTKGKLLAFNRRKTLHVLLRVMFLMHFHLKTLHVSGVIVKQLRKGLSLRLSQKKTSLECQKFQHQPIREFQNP